MLITEGSLLYWNLRAYIVTFTLSNDVAGNLGTIGKYCPYSLNSNVLFLFQEITPGINFFLKNFVWINHFGELCCMLTNSVYLNVEIILTHFQIVLFCLCPTLWRGGTLRYICCNNNLLQRHFIWMSFFNILFRLGWFL